MNFGTEGTISAGSMFRCGTIGAGLASGELYIPLAGQARLPGYARLPRVSYGGQAKNVFSGGSAPAPLRGRRGGPKEELIKNIR